MSVLETAYSEWSGCVSLLFNILPERGLLFVDRPLSSKPGRLAQNRIGPPSFLSHDDRNTGTRPLNNLDVSTCTAIILHIRSTTPEAQARITGSSAARYWGKS